MGEVLKVAKDHLDVEVTEPLANGDGLNVMIKREVVGFRANTVEKPVKIAIAYGQTRCLRISTKRALTRH